MKISLRVDITLMSTLDIFTTIVSTRTGNSLGEVLVKLVVGAPHTTPS